MCGLSALQSSGMEEGTVDSDENQAPQDGSPDPSLSRLPCTKPRQPVAPCLPHSAGSEASRAFPIPYPFFPNGFHASFLKADAAAGCPGPEGRRLLPCLPGMCWAPGLLPSSQPPVLSPFSCPALVSAWFSSPWPTSPDGPRAPITAPLWDPCFSAEEGTTWL